MTKYKQKTYRYNGRSARWGEDLGPERMAALGDGEVILLLGENGEPYSWLLKDSYGKLRERPVKKGETAADVCATAQRLVAFEQAVIRTVVGKA